jgi:hypothetical protein
MSTYKNANFGFKRVSGTELIHGRASTTYGRGRICVTEGCRTRLSLYNPTARCSIHDHLLH